FQLRMTPIGRLTIRVPRVAGRESVSIVGPLEVAASEPLGRFARSGYVGVGGVAEILEAVDGGVEIAGTKCGDAGETAGRGGEAAGRETEEEATVERFERLAPALAAVERS